MLNDYIHYGLLVALAIGLLAAAINDIRARKINNRLTGAIALAAPLFWWSSGLALWPGVAIQLGMGLGVFFALALLFRFRLLGGGDVKLLTALALWITPNAFLHLFLMMALIGGVLAVVMGGYYIASRQRDKMSMPYGIAIACGGLWVLGTQYFPPAGAAIGIAPVFG